MSRAKILLLSMVLTIRVCSGADALEQGFGHPPDSARPWVYWFWINGNVNREAVTADLEAMKRVGIGGVLIMEVDISTPKGLVRFGSPEWLEMFKFVCSEANRLGLEVNMTNDAGWCGSGGPWITPDIAMQTVVTSEVHIEGSKHVSEVLPQPPERLNFYRDIAVLAYPSPPVEKKKMEDFAPSITASAPGFDASQILHPQEGKFAILPLPGTNAPQYVQFEFPLPYLARSLRLSIGVQGRDFHDSCSGEIQVSDDGRNFHSLRPFTIRWDSPNFREFDFTLSAPAARYYRLLFTSFNSGNPNDMDRRLPLAQVDLEPALVIEDLAGKAFYARKDIPETAFEPATSDLVIDPGKVINLTANTDARGLLTWDAPPGDWTILRIGYTPTGVTNHPAPEGGLGLESDKLSKAATEAQFDGLMAKVVAGSTPLVGKSLVATHIDSWETGTQNWTPKMQENFKRLRGYDLLPYLPVLAGHVVGSPEISERFLWDFRQTISNLLAENYAGRMRELANEHGLRLTIEAYGEGPFDDMSYAGQADEPMGEFWSWPNTNYGSCVEMASAAHTYGKRIFGAESFTASEDEKWQSYPGNMKTLGDWALCDGVNRFVFHRYALQPWPDRKPGMSMGPFGVHYERTETWWEQSLPWHEYLARCQYLLQQGLFVADICYLIPEGAPHGFSPPLKLTGFPPTRPGYNFDGCTPEVMLTRMSVKDGRIVLPDGMSYRVLVLPGSNSMTPAFLRKVKELVDAGATVAGYKKPAKSPSLSGYPGCDADVQTIAAQLWDKDISNKSAEELLAARGIPPDFSSGADLRFTHRAIGETDAYFVANPKQMAVETTGTFRVSGKQPEFWWPETGRIEPAAAYQEANGCTSVPLRLESAESVFVVFRASPVAPANAIVGVTRNGQGILAGPGRKAVIAVQKALYGVLDDPARTRDVRLKLQELVNKGTYSFSVSQMADWGDPAPGVVKTLILDYTSDGKPFAAAGIDPSTITINGDTPAEHMAELHRDAQDQLWLEAWQPGLYELKTAGGQTLHADIQSLPQPREITGPWQLSFPPQWGAPDHVAFKKLISWTDSTDPGVKYFSGTAAYGKAIDIPAEMLGNGRRLYLDLGDVQVIAQVKLNGEDLGILWKPPFILDITKAARVGKNSLEVKVTNLWINRMIGDEQLPEDSDRNSGTLRSWPAWLDEGKPSPAGRYSFTTWRLWKKNDPLVKSGLLGPVVLRSVANAAVQ